MLFSWKQGNYILLTPKLIKFTSETPYKYIVEINIRQNHIVSTALLHRWNSTAKTPKLCPMSP